MAQKYPFSLWVYNHISEFTVDELEVWAECGMTTPLSPKIYYGKDDPRDLIPWLDKAESLGMKLIANYEDFSYGNILSEGSAEVERKLREVYEPLKGHPALFGFFAGDEPSTKEALEATVEIYKVHKKVAPELTPYLNMFGDMPYMSPEDLGGRTLEEWFKYVIDETGVSFASQDLYNNTINEVGAANDIRSLKNIVSKAEKAGFDIWANTLSSAHYAYRAPNYHEILWQITVPAACGCRGNVWFRFYDRSIGHEYHSSPIDEYGYKTETYYSILRAQRRFNDQYGELLMTLKRKKTFKLGDNMPDTFPKFKKGDHDLVTFTDESWQDILVSFFEDKDGNEYICAVNAMQKIHASFSIIYDPEKCSLYEVLLNGKKENYFSPATEGKDSEDTKTYLYQGQMRIFRIERK